MLPEHQPISTRDMQPGTFYSIRRVVKNINYNTVLGTFPE
jgi:hypothetical protein